MHLKAVQNSKHTQSLPRLGPIEYRNGGTAFYDAVYYTAKEMAGQPGRRAILLFSDGEENASAHNLMDTTEAAQEHSIKIFSVRYTPRHRNGQPRFRCDGGPQSKTRLSTDLRNAACQLRSGLLNQSAHE